MRSAFDRERIRSIHLGDLRLVHRALRTIEQLREPRPDEIGIERPGEVNVLIAKRNRKGAKEIGERATDGMLDQQLDRRRIDAKAAEELAELGDGVRGLGVGGNL